MASDIYSQKTIKIGTRGSALALRQTEMVSEELKKIYKGLKIEIIVISTHGDRTLDKPLPSIGGKGVFTAELEMALRQRRIDLAVHSLKDLPTAYPDGLTVGAVTARADARDALVSQGGLTLGQLKKGAVVGTSSLRRTSQLRRLRPDLDVRSVRGNIDARVKKVLESKEYDALLLASAGLDRLGMGELIAERISIADVLPAPGQGALAVQCRNETESLELLKPVNHAATFACVTAERAFLASLGGGCAVPVSAYATLENDKLTLLGRVTAVDAQSQVHVEMARRLVQAADPCLLGVAAAKEALGRGARALLAPGGKA